jgi:hypothetical protein
MGPLLGGAGLFGFGAALATIDVGSYLMGDEVAAMIASFLAAIFTGLASIVVSGLFSGGAGA